MKGILFDTHKSSRLISIIGLNSGSRRTVTTGRSGSLRESWCARPLQTSRNWQRLLEILSSGISMEFEPHWFLAIKNHFTRPNWFFEHRPGISWRRFTVFSSVSATEKYSGNIPTSFFLNRGIHPTSKIAIAWIDRISAMRISRQAPRALPNIHHRHKAANIADKSPSLTTILRWLR